MKACHPEGPNPSSHNPRIYETRTQLLLVLFTRKHVMRPKANPGTDGGGGGRRRRPRRTAWCASILLVVTTLVALNTVGVILRSAPERETTDHTNRRDAPVLTNSHHSDELATTHRLTTNDDRVLSLQISNIAISNNNSNNNMVISNIATNNNNNSNNNMDICHNHTWNGNFGNFPNTKYQLGDIIKVLQRRARRKVSIEEWNQALSSFQ